MSSSGSSAQPHFNIKQQLDTVGSDSESIESDLDQNRISIMTENLPITASCESNEEDDLLESSVAESGYEELTDY